MSKYSEKFHSFLISFLTSCIVWVIINLFIFEIKFIHWIIIEILAGIGEIFSTLAKAKVGLKTNTDLDKLNE